MPHRGISELLRRVSARPRQMVKAVWLARSDSVAARGWSIALTLATAALLTVIVLCVLPAKPPGTSNALMFPYLAAVVVFYCSCVWALLEARVTAQAFQHTQETNWRWVAGSVAIFLALTGVLTWKGLTGDEGERAITLVNCYLTKDLLVGCEKSPLRQPFNYVGAASNSAAILLVVYLGFQCWNILRTHRKQTAPPLRAYARALADLLLHGSTVLVTSTLTIYLLFAAADAMPLQETQAGGAPAVADPTPHSVPSLIAEGTGTVACAPGPALAFECKWIASKEKKPRSAAPIMAFVTGLAFSAALSLLFMTAGAALEDMVQRRMTLARQAAEKARKEFHAKAWLEAQGLTEGARDLLFRLLAVLAPAATGAIALITG